MNVIRKKLKNLLDSPLQEDYLEEDVNLNKIFQQSYIEKQKNAPKDNGYSRNSFQRNDKSSNFNNYNRQPNKTKELVPIDSELLRVARKLIDEISKEVLEEDKGYLPGFSTRVRAYALDEMAEIHGNKRLQEDVLAIDYAMRQYSRDNKRKNIA